MGHFIINKKERPKHLGALRPFFTPSKFTNKNRYKYLGGSFKFCQDLTETSINRLY